jgi:hypothetical protein
LVEALTPLLVAVTVIWIWPTSPLVVKVEAVARPVAPLVVEKVVVPLEKVPLGPVDGAVKTTVAPGT